MCVLFGIYFILLLNNTRTNLIYTKLLYGYILRYDRFNVKMLSVMLHLQKYFYGAHNPYFHFVNVCYFHSIHISYILLLQVVSMFSLLIFPLPQTRKIAIIHRIYAISPMWHELKLTYVSFNWEGGTWQPYIVQLIVKVIRFHEGKICLNKERKGLE